MKRTPLNPGTKPLRRKKPMPRPSKPMAKRNTKRARKRRVEGVVYGWYHREVMKLPCAVAEYGKRPHVCEGPIDGHHDVSVKRGGKDEMNEIPLCRLLHTLDGKAVHNMGRQSFQDYWGFSIDTAKVVTWAKIMGEERRVA